MQLHSTLVGLMLAAAPIAAVQAQTAPSKTGPKVMPSTSAVKPSKPTARTDRDGPAPAPAKLPPVDLWLHLLHNNDGECKVLPLTGAQTGFGGAARFVSLVNNLKGEAETPRGDGVAQGWVMVSSGDNILPGINLNASINKGVPYYDSILFDLIGYSAVTLGNHDFDSNPDVLAELITGTSSTTFISANLDFSLEPGLFAQQVFGKLAKSEVVTVAGRQVGIVGATTESLPLISSPRNTIVNPVAAAVQAEIDALTANGVGIILLSTHLQGLTSELALIPMLSGVDAVIAGGGSVTLELGDRPNKSWGTGPDAAPFSQGPKP